MPVPSAQEIKKALVQAGFEVYRTRGDEVQLAERPRENLIMDSGVSVVVGEPLRLRFVVRAQRADFQSDADAELFGRARALGQTCVDRGYIELDTRARALLDPGDASRVLDTWYEVIFERSLGSLDEAVAELRIVMKLEKAVVR
jgi:hypothetical protein